MAKQNKSRITCLLHSPTPHDTTSYYRGHGPYMHLERNHEDITIFPVTKDVLNDWPSLMMADVLILQRPFMLEHVRSAMMAKDMGLKVVVDYDDALLSVPIENKVYPVYMKEDIRKNIAQLISIADVVTVSTEELKKIYNNKPIVIPNGFDERWLSKYRNMEQRESPNLVWRGSDTHVRDINVAGPGIRELYKEHENLNFHFFGYFPYELLDGFDQKRYRVQKLAKEEYLLALTRTDGSIGWVSLIDNQFNRAKSNIGWIELTFSGHATLASDLPEFHLPGVTNFKTAEEFKEKANELIKDKELRKKNFLESREYLWGNFQLSKINEKRYQMIRELV